MVKGLNHIAIIVSCEQSLDFYKKLGFNEIYRQFNENKNQTIVFLNDNNNTLEIFIRSANRRDNENEQNGLRHICFDVNNIDDIKKCLCDYKIKKEITMQNGKRILFIYDYDNQPIEFAEEGAIIL